MFTLNVNVLFTGYLVSTLKQCITGNSKGETTTVREISVLGGPKFLGRPCTVFIPIEVCKVFGVLAEKLTLLYSILSKEEYDQ